MLEVSAVTSESPGLGLEGPSRRTDPNVGDHTRRPGARQTRERQDVIDHNDISGWTGAGIEVIGPGRAT